MTLFKTCPVCQKRFETQDKLKVYCGPRCKGKARSSKQESWVSSPFKVSQDYDSPFKALRRERKALGRAHREKRVHEGVDSPTLEWLEKRSTENLVRSFREELTAVSNGASPDGLLPYGPRRQLIKCGVIRLFEGRGRSLRLTPKGKRILAAAKEVPHEGQERIPQIGVEER